MGQEIDFKFGTQLDHRYPQPTDDITSMKGAWLWSRDPFKFSVPPKISIKWLKLETSKFVHWFAMW